MTVRLLVQPGDGAAPLIKGIHSAKSSVEIAIFRFDHREIETALAQAVSRGIAVRALIANTNRAGEQSLRALELRLLGAGVTVARTAGDLQRYHGKLMIVDRREVYILAFNLTYMDIERSRSFGVITRRPRLVAEAARLFESDSRRLPYEPASDTLVISPSNARARLAAFIQGARKELLIYDPKISDPDMIRLLEERARKGVMIRIIGKLTHEARRLEVRKLQHHRLHTRTMIRDQHDAFVGSQSLREIELDLRREIGVIFRDAKAVSQLVKAFNGDWHAGAPSEQAPELAAPVEKLAKRVAKAVARELPAVAPVVNNVVKELVAETGELMLNAESVEQTVNEAVRQAVKEAVQDVVEEAVEHSPEAK